MRKMIGVLVMFALITTAFLNVGTVRKKESHVSKVQTSGIKLKDKLEELKDGEKGPATPTYGWYGGENGFMGAPPFAEETPEAALQSSIPRVSEVNLPYASLEEDALKEGEDGQDWSDDWGDESFNDPEAMPVEADTYEDQGSPAKSSRTADTTSSEDSSKWDKDWWDEI